MITEYVKGTPYFTDNEKKIGQFPYLTNDITCKCLVIGGGIDGAIALNYLAKNNIDCAMIEKNRLGFSNTSCATALLEYQLDEFAIDLKNSLNEEEVIASYRLGLFAIEKIDNFINENVNNCHYSKRPTFCYTQKKSEYKDIFQEYEFRTKNGFNAEFMSKQNNKFNFDIKAGLYCPDGGAEFNPYLFTKQMIDDSCRFGGKIYENTEAIKIEYGEEYATVYTNYGNKIRCNTIICATGYNTKLFTSKRLCDKYVSYTIVTSPIENFEWFNRALLHDNSDPYHYIRLSPDNRIIIGGEDIPFKNDTIKEEDAKKKYQLLDEYLLNLFPDLKDKYTIDYKFCGAFSSTKNNLGIIGTCEDNDKLFYMLGYGANGILYSFLGGEMLIDYLNGAKSKYQYLFSPDRTLV